MAQAPRRTGQRSQVAAGLFDDPELAKREKEHALKEKAQRLEIELKEKTLALDVAKYVFRTFIALNLAVYLYIVAITIFPFFLPAPGAPLVTERVVLGLIAGSTTQLGALALAVGKRLWR